MNDWYLKMEYSNVLTGKLSDFAGLIAFPFFFTIIFPSQKKFIHILTALIFVVWNSHLVQPIIDIANSFHIPIGRTVDITDSIALISILVSFKMCSFSYNFRLRPMVVNLVMLCSCFAFMATTMTPREKRTYVDINKAYEFEISKSELVSRLNMIQIREVDRLNQNPNNILFDADKNIFHFQGQTDTLALILDSSKINDSDTFHLNTLFASLIITGENQKSKIALVKVAKLTSMNKDKNYKKKAIKQFEKRVIKKIKNYR